MASTTARKDEKFTVNSEKTAICGKFPEHIILRVYFQNESNTGLRDLMPVFFLCVYVFFLFSAGSI